MPRTGRKMYRANFFCTAVQYQRLRSIAAAQGCSIGEVLRRAIDVYLNAYDKRQAERKQAEDEQ